MQLLQIETISEERRTTFYLDVFGLPDIAPSNVLSLVMNLQCSDDPTVGAPRVKTWWGLDLKPGSGENNSEEADEA